MVDAIYWAQLTDLTPAIEAFPAEPDSLMILERLPLTWLDEEARRTGMRFEPFRANEPFNRWERGRIFNETGELRWEKIGELYHTVYVGEAGIELPDSFHRDETIDLSCPVPTGYYLWGRRLPAQAAALLERPGANLFAEFTTGSIITEYPVAEPANDQARRVILKMVAYLDPRTRRRVYYRFQGVAWDEPV